MKNVKYITLDNLSYYDGRIKDYITDQISTVNGTIGNIKGFSTKIVSTLPATGDTATIYLVAATVGTSENESYDEYLYLDTGWEKIGNTRLTLDGYLTTEEVNQAIDDAVKAYVPFSVVTELPAINDADSKKIYVLTVATDTIQKGSYVAVNGTWVSVGTTVTPATNPEVPNAEPSENPSGGDYDAGADLWEDDDPQPVPPATKASQVLTYNIGAALVGNTDVSEFMTAANIADADELEELAQKGDVKMYYLGTNNVTLDDPLVIPYADTEEADTFSSSDNTFTGSGAHYWVVNDDTAIAFSSNINAVVNGTKFKLVDERA